MFSGFKKIKNETTCLQGKSEREWFDKDNSLVGLRCVGPGKTCAKIKG